MNDVNLHRGLHWVALLTAIATFPLIFMGGLVTTHGAGMAVPDWPNSYGYNMVLFPPSQWMGGIWYEHVHRLYATAIGFLAVVLTLLAWGPAERPGRRRWLGWTTVACGVLTAGSAVVLASAGITSDFGRHFQHVAVGFGSLMLVFGVAWMARSKEPRRWVRWLAVGVLAAVIFQGVLGGLRVVMVELDLAIVHGCFAQAFFCLTALLAVVTSRGWLEAPDLSGSASARPLVRLAVIAVVVVYLQLIVGAVMRHYEAGLAIPDFPLSYGKLLPPMSQAAADQASWNFLHEPDAEMFTLGQMWLHFGHRIGAGVVTVALLALSVHVLRDYRDQKVLKRPAILLLVLLAAQVTLGILTVLLRKPADIASAHVAVGALVLVTAFVLWVRALRLYSPRRGRRIPGFEVEPVGSRAVTA